MQKIQVIAEIAGGHMGDLSRCLDLVKAAKHGDADAVKFQFYKADELCEKSHSDYELFKSLEFSIEEWQTIFEQVRLDGLLIYADIFGSDSFQEATTLAVDGFKLHSADLDNVPLVESVAKISKTIFLGTGGHKRIEIYQSLKRIREVSSQAQIVLMPGHQLFPTPVAEHSLEEIAWFSKAYRDMDVAVGCADHIDGDDPAALSFPVAAVGAGARFIEKHLTIRRTDKWEDYESAIEPDSFKTLTSMVRALDVKFSPFPVWTEGRQVYREKSVKSFFSVSKMEEKSSLSDDHLKFLRPTEFTNPIPYGFISNKKLGKGLERDSMIKGTDVDQTVGILINCRTQSARLPQKALKKICGKETIALLIERMKFCTGNHKIILCTTEKKEDDILIEIAKREGIEVFRGPEKNVALRLLLASKEFGLDHIVRVTGDDILRDINLIDSALISHLESHADYTYMEGVVYSCDSEIISVRALETIGERANVLKNTEYLTWYLDDESAFVCNKMVVDKKYWRDYRLTLDTIEDLELLDKVYSALYSEGKPIDLLSVLEFLDNNPAIAKVNETIEPKLAREDLDVSVLI